MKPRLENRIDNYYKRVLFVLEAETTVTTVAGVHHASGLFAKCDASYQTDGWIRSFACINE